MAQFFTAVFKPFTNSSCLNMDLNQWTVPVQCCELIRIKIHQNVEKSKRLTSRQLLNSKRPTSKGLKYLPKVFMAIPKTSLKTL